MINKRVGGPLGVPQGDITVENPDGVSKTFGEGQVLNSLTNSSWARGGSDGGGYGAFPEEHDSNVPSLFGRSRDTKRFRID